MYKMKQRFTIEYELGFEELCSEEFEELGFNSNETIKDVLQYNLKNIKEDILKEYRHDNTQKVNFITLKSGLEIYNGKITSRISEELEDK